MTAATRPFRTDLGAARLARGARGFTFLEILIVMAIVAVLLGLGIGFLTSAGRVGLAQQAAEIVAESGRRCLNMSAGGKRATLEIRTIDVDGDKRLEVQTAVQRVVLTSNFELQPEWLVNANEPSIAKTTGAVRLEPAGKSGACAVFTSGSSVEYGSRSAFAMTDGVEVDAWVRPEVAGRDMALLTADEDGAVVWRVSLLASAGRAAAFDLKFEVAEVPADAVEATSPGSRRTFVTKSGAVPAGQWSQLHVGYDGRDCVLAVNGVDRVRAERGAPPSARRTTRMWVPPSGSARITTGTTYVGALDTLTVAGVFRSDEDVRRLPYGVTLFRTPSPTRVVFLNGRLDPTVHKADVEVRVQGPADVDGASSTLVRFGLYGSLSSPTFSPGAVFPGSPGAVFPGSPGAVFPGSPGAVFPGSPGAVSPGSPGAVAPGASAPRGLK